ncbi:MAG TPA: phage BR0599 family protein [Candidatus Bathyarchaeia archaeon]|nr:phage BR0599 family protein [Candidatus Bathyarchaeia archaeon]
MTDADGRPVGGRRRAWVRRAWSGQDNLGSSFASAEYSTASAAPLECYKFFDGTTTYRYTSADLSVTLSVVDSGTYTPKAIERDSIDFSQEDTSQAIAVRLPRTDPLAGLFIAYNPVNPVAVTIYRKHRNTAEEVTIFVGRIVTVTFDGPQASLTCAPISEVFRRRVPSLVYQSQCNWALYGSGCGIAKASFKDSGTVLSVSGPTLRAAVFATRPDGWYENGWAELANGDKRFIIRHVGDTITLQSPFPNGSVGTGSAIDGYAGCDRSEATCAAKFSNLNRHLGFPRIPSRNPYEGSIL